MESRSDIAATGSIQGANATPTKRFFVSMLTRDITLDDAILDLVDNCLDGIMRLNSTTSAVSFENFHIEVFLNPSEFIIKDNCGGISRKIAIEKAFKFGRESDDNRDSDIESIGVYGIGMKRALLKMGCHSLVRTNHKGDQFEVVIDSEWINDKSWNKLPLMETEVANHLTDPGTYIRVSELYSSVKHQFSSNFFVDELIKSISIHFTRYIHKGLKIFVNNNEVKPILLQLLISDRAAPFVYQEEIDGVLVTIAVGLNSNIPAEEYEESDFETDRATANSGWSVFCNDRAIIVGDKSRLTGWGDGLPMFHAQYSILTGIVEFRTKDASKLPVTSTKRALDASSELWLRSRVKMKEAMRIWISYTNDWKNHPRSEQKKYWLEAKPKALDEVLEIINTRIGRRHGILEFNPKKHNALPRPDTQQPSSRKIVFSRPAEEIDAVSLYLFDSKEKPGIVGDECFSIVLKQFNTKS